MHISNQKQTLSDWLYLIQVPELGPVRLLTLLDHFKTPTHILQTDFSDLTKIGLKPSIASNIVKAHKNSAIQNNVDKALHWLAQSTEHHILTWDAPQYPWLLKHIHAAPLLLFVKGNINALSMPSIGIVGTRHPSPNGMHNAFHFSQGLAQSGLSIVSGLAIGVDTQAHLGALAAQQGTTIGVLGTGLDCIYPKRNESLALQMIEQQGALVSEFFLGTAPKASHFPQRNRLISGLCLGILVIEAALRSGSLITARYALEQSREVFAIPGSIQHPLSRGCHALIQSGAKLVERIEDVLEECYIAPSRTSQVEKTMPSARDDLSKDPGNVVYYLNDDQASSIDMLALQSGLSIENLSTSLLELELTGQVIAVAGGYVRAPRKHL